MANPDTRKYSSAEVGIRLKLYWEKSGKTQAELAVELGISQPLLYQIMNDDRSPTESVLRLLRMKVVERHYVEIGR